MKVVVLGATGNVGTSVVRSLCGDSGIDSVVGVARRPGGFELDKLEWAQADIRSADLARLFDGADAVVHLAWLIQPSHRPDVLASVNVDGSRRVFEAVREAGVPALVYASSVGTYARGQKMERVGEDWPATGIPSSSYALHKATVEEMLDELERSSPGTRIVRLRPALTFKRSAGAEIRRYFLGRMVPAGAVHPRLIPVVPDVARLRFQVAHAEDVADAYRRAVTQDARGAYNVAAEPEVDPAALAELLGARLVPVPARLARAVLWSTWRARLQPTSEGWLDMALSVPLMSTERIRRELGWSPRHGSRATILELMAGVRRREAIPTAVLAGDRPGRA